MKKILFLFLVGIAMLQLGNAQDIAIKGSGVLDQDNVNITFGEFSNIDHVVVEAMAFIVTGSNTTPTAQVLFNGNAADFNYVEVNKSLGPNPFDYGDGTYSHKGYYTMTFDDTEIAGGVELDKNGLGNEILTYYAYVYYDDGDVNTYCMHEDVPVGDFNYPRRGFIHLNGKSNPVVYHFTLDPIDGTRDIELTMPFSDNEPEAERYVSISLFGDGSTANEEFKLNEADDNLRIETLMLADVGGDVTDIRVEVYSPNPEAPDEDPVLGDSFYMGMPFICVTDKPEDDRGCTLTQGYWKTHSEMGPAPYDDTWAELTSGASTTFYLSGMSWYEVFQTPVSGNAYYNLAHQFMAAHLNMLAGASVPTEVQDAYDAADAIFVTNAPGYYEKVKGKSDASKEEIAELVALAGILTDYNEGTIGPGHCDDLEELEKSARIKIDAEINDLSVYPNPVRNVSTISFKPRINGRVTIDLYNSLGQKMNRLMDRNVKEGIPVNLSINGQDYREGLYLLRVRNESSISTVRVQISR